jgi:hypothetical protein
MLISLFTATCFGHHHQALQTTDTGKVLVHAVAQLVEAMRCKVVSSIPDGVFEIYI